MRRFIVFLMLFLLPFQISWAVAANYCEHGHGQDKATISYFGHHDDEHKASPDTPDDSRYDFAHDHCHLLSFLGVLSANTFAMSDSLQPSLHSAGRPRYPSLAPDKPERPKWSVPA